MFYTVSRSALFQRLNRKLRHEGLKVCKSKGQAEKQYLGEYYLLDFTTNTIKDWHSDPVELAKENKLIRLNEELAN